MLISRLQAQHFKIRWGVSSLQEIKKLTDDQILKTPGIGKIFLYRIRQDNTPTESVVVLFGSESDSDVAASKTKLLKAGREVQLVPRPSFDTGLGMCGKHLCGCKTICTAKFAELEKKFG